MNPTTNQEHDEAQEILEALRQIQDDPALKAEAEKSPELIREAPVTTSVRRLDQALAARQPNLRWRPADEPAPR